MQHSDRRKCNSCSHPVTYFTLNDGYSGDIKQFVAYVPSINAPAVVINCPSCGQQLSLENTTAV